MSEWTAHGQVYAVVCQAAQRLFSGGKSQAAQKDALVEFILNRTNPQKGFLFYPTDAERTEGIRLITGEKPRTRLLANHAVDLETLRLLVLLKPEDAGVLRLLERANEQLEKQCFASVCVTGECAGSSIAYLRYLTACGVEAHRAKILHGLAVVKAHRSGSGRWARFPARFTLRWLQELPPALGGAELAYALAGG